jgi:maltokinase
MTQLADELPDLLSSWLPQQNWFADGDHGISLVRVIASIALLTGEPALDLVLLEVEFQADITSQNYQLLIGRRRLLPNDLQLKAIGAVDDAIAYDGLWDPYVTSWLLDELADASSYEGVRFVREPEAEVPRGITSRVLSEDGSKTSLTYGDECTLKLFRRELPGTNLDLEIHRALRRAGNEHVAQLRAAIEGNWDGEHVTIGMLQDSVINPAEGWAMAMVSVRDLLAEQDLRADEVGGDFAAEAFRLGQAVAATHADLAWTLGTSEQDPHDLAEAMNARLSAVQSAVPALSEHASSIQAAYAEVGKLNAPITTQRIHGNLHLHTILRTTPGWLFVDFGGEVTKPLAERARPDSVLYDVAGVMHSLDQAARHQLAEWSQSVGYGLQLERRAHEWSARNRSSFCDGYAQFTGVDPRDQSALLLAYELDRVVYEFLRSAHIPPNWNNEFESISRLTANL